MRIELPDTRDSLTHKRVICGHKCYFTVSFMESGDEENRCKPAEVFVQIAKEGTLVAGLVNAISWLVSTSLQNGIAWEEVSRGLRHHTFERRDDTDHTSLIDGIAKSVDHLILERKKRIGVGEEPPKNGQYTMVVQSMGKPDQVVSSPTPMISGIRQAQPVPGFGALVALVNLKGKPHEIGLALAHVSPRTTSGLTGGPIVCCTTVNDQDEIRVAICYEDASHCYIRPSGEAVWSTETASQMSNDALAKALTAADVCGAYKASDRRETLIQQYLMLKGLLNKDGKPNALTGGH